MKTILVLGAYGLVGREITKGLLRKTDYSVLASGRNENKLNAIVSNTKSSRLTPLILNADNQDELRSACKKADLVINCIGPYSLNGYEIARCVIKSGLHYIDFANEQIHYQRLKSLHKVAEEKGLMLLTAAGQIPGVSTLIATYGYHKIRNASSMEIYLIQGRVPDPEAGIAGFVGAILEPLFNTLQYEDGKFEKAGIGPEYKKISVPGKYNVTHAISIPTIDVLILPRYLSIKSIRVYFGIDLKPPPGIFSIIKLLKPHKREWSYQLVHKIVKNIVRKGYYKAIKKGSSPDGLLKLIIKNSNNYWEGIVPFDNGGELASYLPILMTKKLFEGKIKKSGLLSVLDIYDYHQFLEDLHKISWDITLQEVNHKV